jgi:hypothetical protein
VKPVRASLSLTIAPADSEPRRNNTNTMQPLRLKRFTCSISGMLRAGSGEHHLPDEGNCRMNTKSEWVKDPLVKWVSRGAVVFMFLVTSAVGYGLRQRSATS